MQFLARLIVMAVSTALAVWLVPGITLDAGDTNSQVLTLLSVSLVFGVINAIIKPLTQVLSACLIVLTLGLFLLVINGWMLLLTSWVAGQLGLGFHVDGFTPAFWGALIISVAGTLFGGLLGSKRD